MYTKGDFINYRLAGAPWWRHQMETFPRLALYEGNSPGTGEFPSQRPVTQSFDGFSDLRLNKRLSKKSRRRLFEKPPRPLWRHCNDTISNQIKRIHDFFLSLVNWQSGVMILRLILQMYKRYISYVLCDSIYNMLPSDISLTTPS